MPAQGQAWRVKHGHRDLENIYWLKFTHARGTVQTVLHL